MKKRLIIGLLVGATVFAGVFAMAATLGVSSSNLAAGNSVVANCDASVTTAYGAPAYNTTGSAGYKVTSVTIGAIADGCDGQAISVTLTGASNAELGTKTGTVDVDSTADPTPDTSDTFDFSGLNIPAASVTGVHVVISG